MGCKPSLGRAGRGLFQPPGYAGHAGPRPDSAQWPVNYFPIPVFVYLSLEIVLNFEIREELVGMFKNGKLNFVGLLMCSST
jgi:hypothetical protein